MLAWTWASLFAGIRASPGRGRAQSRKFRLTTSGLSCRKTLQTDYSLFSRAQGGFGLPRPGIFGSRSFDTLTPPAPSDGVAADSAAPDAAAEQPDLAADPPPPPPPKVPPPPPAPSAARGRRNGSLNTTTASAPAPAPGGARFAPAPGPGLPAAGNTTAVSFSELIASAALAPAPREPRSLALLALAAEGLP